MEIREGFAPPEPRSFLMRTEQGLLNHRRRRLSDIHWGLRSDIVTGLYWGLGSDEDLRGQGRRGVALWLVNAKNKGLWLVQEEVAWWWGAPPLQSWLTGQGISQGAAHRREEKVISKCQKFYWMLHLSKPSPALSHPKMSVKMSSPSSRSAKCSPYPRLLDPQQETF